MSRLGQELRDPWGPLVGAVAGGLAWAVGAALPVAGAVGLAVYGVKVALGASAGEPEPEGPARPHPDSAAGLWLRRGESAVRALQDMAREPGTGPADEATRTAAHEAAEVVAAMRRLGGHVVTIGRALSHTDSPTLDDEAARLQAIAERDPADVTARRSADAVTDRVAVRDRLRGALVELEGRLQSSALGLEGLVARVAEVRAAAAAVGELDLSDESLAELTTEVEGLRQGLAAAERVANRALAGPS